jgi:hypothetical protein
MKAPCHDIKLCRTKGFVFFEEYATESVAKLEDRMVVCILKEGINNG